MSDTIDQPEASTSTLSFIEPTMETKKPSVADKWVKPNGPPVGSTFGARLLSDEQDPFEHNAWDHVTLPEDFNLKAEEIMKLHHSNPVNEKLRDGYNSKPAEYWNKFYSNHEDGFFKDRGWLRLEFPELVACSEADAGPKTVLEVGCGAGNTVFPLLMRNENPELNIYATDYSSKAVQVVKSNKMYPKAEHGLGQLHASVWDITSKSSSSSSTKTKTDILKNDKEVTSVEDSIIQNTKNLSITNNSNNDDVEKSYSLPEGIKPNSVDVISVIFVLSALHPKEWNQAIHNLYTALKPGGLLLIRDYGRHDLAQLRIKKNRLIDPEIPNLYIRGDGTRVYFFEQDDFTNMLSAPSNHDPDKRMFDITQLGQDRRLLVNRKEKKQMYRIWLQVKAKKL
ncbi:uncharacterized protein L201_001584 [Kwoniella dendrophila CBS 6074]|uniref:tRNA N(3)-methylcytidine methyltransferase n=1 Tax=Kwoniella dendrophila CBS 6074 TaxID=1295534 RepID=A0AAX4JMQ2_9TREE